MYHGLKKVDTIRNYVRYQREVRKSIAVGSSDGIHYVPIQSIISLAWAAPRQVDVVNPTLTKYRRPLIYIFVQMDFDIG